MVQLAHEIRFTYLPGSPLDNGWSSAYASDGAEAVFSSDPSLPGSLLMTVKSGLFAIDYEVPAEARECDACRFTIRYSDTGMMFAQVGVKSRDGRTRRKVWIKFFEGEMHVERTNDAVADPDSEIAEHVMWVPGRRVRGGLVEMDLDLNEVVKFALGKEGWVYSHLTRIRLRGTATVSSIRLLSSLGDDVAEPTAASQPGQAPTSRPWMAVAGSLFGAATLLFFMWLVATSAQGQSVPSADRYLTVIVLALGGGLSTAFLGGAAVAKGTLQLPKLGSRAMRPIEFATTSGIAVVVIILTLGNVLFVGDRAPLDRPVPHGDSPAKTPEKTTAWFPTDPAGNKYKETFTYTGPNHHEVRPERWDPPHAPTTRSFTLKEPGARILRVECEAVSGPVNFDYNPDSRSEADRYSPWIMISQDRRSFTIKRNHTSAPTTYKYTAFYEMEREVELDSK